MTQQIFNQALPYLQNSGVVVEEGTQVRSPEHRPSLSDAQQKAADEYVRMLESNPYSPPTDSPLNPEMLNLLADEGRVVKVSETVVFSASAYRDMVDKISAHIKENGEVSVGDVRDMFGTSRKYAMALVDYLDQQRITRRVGDVRVLR
jgi:selenocysteine-specific elongation factor